MMTNRTLRQRLKKLEARFSVGTEPFHLVLGFVAANGDVTGTVTFRDGKEEWWHAPGHERVEIADRGR